MQKCMYQKLLFKKFIMHYQTAGALLEFKKKGAAQDHNTLTICFSQW